MTEWEKYVEASERFDRECERLSNARHVDVIGPLMRMVDERINALAAHVRQNLDAAPKER